MYSLPDLMIVWKSPIYMWGKKATFFYYKFFIFQKDESCCEGLYKHNVPIIQIQSNNLCTKKTTVYLGLEHTSFCNCTVKVV